MKAKTMFSKVGITRMVRAGFDFWVPNERARRIAWEAATYNERVISTRENKERGGFNIYFLNGGAK